jgi:PAS domain S-box-containing protein
MTAQNHLKNESYKTLIQQSPFGFAYHKVLLDASGIPYDYRFIEVNDAFEAFTGLKSADIVGKTVKEVLPGIEDSNFDWIAVYGKLALEGGSKTFQGFMEPLNQWFNVQAYSIEKYFFATVFTDITRQKESEMKVRALSDASFEAIFISEKGICKDQNKTAELLFGYSQKEAIGKPGTDWIAEKDREKVLQNMLSGYEATYEVTALRKDGTTFPAEIQAKMVYVDDRSIRVTALRDITERKKAREAIETEEKLRQIIDNIKGVFWLRSANRQEVLYVSPGYCDLFGEPLQNLVDYPASFTKLVHPDDKKRITDAYSNFISSGEFKEEYRILRHDGTIRWVSSQAFPVNNETGETIRYAGIITDITATKESELMGLKLRSIRNQLDPHFTFNAFNAIASSIFKEGDRQSYAYFTKFSKLLRGSMIYSDDMYRLLSEEIEHTRHYLDIEKFRFKDKFDFVINIDNNVDVSIPVPRMIIQAYAETAIANGLMHKTENGLLTIDVKLHHETVKITITDNGVGMQQAKEYGKFTAFASSDLMTEFIANLNNRNTEKVVVKMHDIKQSGSVLGTQVDISFPLNMRIAVN